MSRQMSPQHETCMQHAAKDREHPTNADRRVNPKQNSSINHGTRDMLRARSELQFPQCRHFRRMDRAGCCLIYSESITKKGPHLLPISHVIMLSFIHYMDNILWEPPTLIQALANHSLGAILC
jgi:hypothetical protein